MWKPHRTPSSSSLFCDGVLQLLLLDWLLHWARFVAPEDPTFGVYRAFRILLITTCAADSGDSQKSTYDNSFHKSPPLELLFSSDEADPRIDQEVTSGLAYFSIGILLSLQAAL